MRHNLTYNSWKSFRARCNRATVCNYSDYGGKGITYDPAWDKFEQFVADMGERPENTTLDRIDNSKGYFKENCRWANHKEQSSNRSCVKMITFDGVTLNALDWAKKLGLSRGAIWNRIYKFGWDIERAVTTPKGGKAH